MAFQVFEAGRSVPHAAVLTNPIRRFSARSGHLYPISRAEMAKIGLQIDLERARRIPEIIAIVPKPGASQLKTGTMRVNHIRSTSPISNGNWSNELPQSIPINELVHIGAIVLAEERLGEPPTGRGIARTSRGHRIHLAHRLCASYLQPEANARARREEELGDIVAAAHMAMLEAMNEGVA